MKKRNLCLDDFDEVLTAEDVADILKISKPLTYKLLKENKIPSKKCGRNIRIPKKMFEKYLKGEELEQKQEQMEVEACH